MDLLKELVEQISTWPGVSVRPHRFGGNEFCFGYAEIGHIHPGGILDLPMPRAFHDALLEEGLAEEHHWVPNSGWITFRIREQQDLKHALWLARLSYLRYALDDPRDAYEQETQRLQLSPRFAEQLEKFVPSHASTASQNIAMAGQPAHWWQLGL